MLAHMNSSFSELRSRLVKSKVRQGERGAKARSNARALVSQPRHFKTTLQKLILKDFLGFSSILKDFEGF